MKDPRHITVAGAGHGGLVAAKHLADAGFSVTVYEKRMRSELGYDWEDCIPSRVFKNAGLTPPEEKHLRQMPQNCFISPKKDVKVVCPEHKSIAVIERKFLYDHLISECEKSGVQFVYGTAVSGLEYENGQLANVVFGDGSKEECGMVIDAAGMYSPLCECLPADSLTERGIESRDVFYAYRAYFEYNGNEKLEPPYNICFFHCGHVGMDWLITGDDVLDVLIGSFGSLTREQIDEALEDYGKDFPEVLVKPVRGGSVGVIPVRRAMPVFVYNGYAAVGDSAFMTEPLSGSGISLSMYAGKILAGVIASAGGEYSAARLWEYNRSYMEHYGLHQLGADNTRRLLLSFTEADMEYAFRTRIIGERELAGVGKYSARNIAGKAVNIARRPSLIPALTRFAADDAARGKIVKSLPREYSYEAVKKWSGLYMQKG